MLGLGQFLAEQDGTAFLALHEGCGWFADLFKQGPGGGVEELNQVMDHDLYKNSPLVQISKFYVRSPHLVAAVMMHLKEVVQHAEAPDSVAGLMRLLHATFPPVPNKIVPPGLDEAGVKKLLEEDPHYFNNLAIDDVVECMANVMRVAGALYTDGKNGLTKRNLTLLTSVRVAHGAMGGRGLRRSRRHLQRHRRPSPPSP